MIGKLYYSLFVFVVTEESWFYSRYEQRIYCSPKAPDLLYGSLNLLFNGYLGLFRQGKVVRARNWP
jgi:hypothetical protein